jgi:hypothetical protein
MKRVSTALAILLALTMLLTGCASAQERQQRKEALNILSGTATTTYALSTGTTIENQTLYSDSKLTVQLAGIQGTPTDPELVLAIKNGTRGTVYFSVDALVFNGWQVDGWSDPYEIGARSVVLATVSCSDPLTDCGITDIESVGINYAVYDNGYEDLAQGSALCQTSAPASDEEVQIDGVPLMEEDGFVVKATNVRMGSSSRVSLYLENQTDRAVYLETLHVRVNGEPVEMWMWEKLLPSARRMSSTSLYEEDTYDSVSLESGDIITFDLQVKDYDSSTILLTKSVTLDTSNF